MSVWIRSAEGDESIPIQASFLTNFRWGELVKRKFLKSKADDFAFSSALETCAEHRAVACLDGASLQTRSVTKSGAATGMEVSSPIGSFPS